jgi:hypothetical protein
VSEAEEFVELLLLYADRANIVAVGYVTVECQHSDLWRQILKPVQLEVGGGACEEIQRYPFRLYTQLEPNNYCN